MVLHGLKTYGDRELMSVSISHRLPFRTPLFMLAISAIVTVFVAWACALWSPYTHHTAPPVEPLVDGYPGTVTGPDGSQAYWFTRDGPGLMAAEPSGAHGADGRFLYWSGRHTPAYYRSGWPMFAVQSVVQFEEGAAGRYLSRWELSRGEIFHRGLQTSLLPAWSDAQPERRLPLVPLWPGFAVDILLYFLALMGLRCLWFRIASVTGFRHE
jgi:hypothetical protein